MFFASDEGSSDLLDFNYPQRVFLASHLKQNRLPLWSPYQSNGFPFLAEAQTGVFYPINLILFKLLDPGLAFNWSIISSFMILAFGSYLSLRYLKLSRLACLFAGLLIPFSGFFITQLKHVQLLQAGAFLPFSLLFVERIIQAPNRYNLILLSVFFSASILAGHIPTAYSIMLFSTIYFFIRLQQESKQRQESFKPIGVFFLGLICSLALSAVQLIPTLEMIPYSTRTSLSNLPANFPFSQLMTFLVPFYFGDPSLGTYNPMRPSFWENSGFIGIIPLGLAIYCFFIKGKGGVFKILLILSLFFVLGFPRAIFDFGWNFLPGLSLTRLPSRFLLFSDFFLLVLAAFSIERFLRKDVALGPAQRRKKIFIVIFILFLSLFELWSNFYFYNGQFSTKLWNQLPKSTGFLQQDHDYFRIMTLNQVAAYNLTSQKAKGWRDNILAYLAAKEQLPATLNSLFDIKSIHFPNEYFGSFSLARRSQLSLLTQGELIKEKFSTKLLGLQNVKYILSLGTMPDEATASFKLAWQSPTQNELPAMSVYENPQFLPRAYLVQNSTVLKESEIIPLMISDEFDPKKQVILEKPTFLAKDDQRPITDNIALVEDNEERLTYSVSNSLASYFVLTDTFYPGWKARVDGQEVEILRANYAFRAIKLPAGSHKVEFEYNPISVKIGAAISLITLSLLMVMIIKRDKLQTWWKNYLN